MKFWIGTSGFQYAEWKGNFYPEDLPAAKMLAFYRRTPFDHRDQLHVPSHSGCQDNRQLETTDTRAFSLCPEGAAEDHALVETA